MYNSICECGNQKNKVSKKCTTCYAMGNRKTERPPYNELICDINELGYRGTGKKYGVSDNSIRKWVKAYERLQTPTTKIKKTITKTCKFCNNEFEIYPSLEKQGKGKFCSLVCVKGYNKINKKDKYYKVLARKHQLKYRYDLSLEEYNSLLEKQNNVCDICGCDFSKDGDKECVDHCHETGKIRGVLCNKCNTGLGMFKDNIGNLKNAILYLKKT